MAMPVMHLSLKWLSYAALSSRRYLSREIKHAGKEWNVNCSIFALKHGNPRTKELGCEGLTSDRPEVA